MIPFLNRNNEKWPHTRQIKIEITVIEITFFHRWELNIHYNYAKLINPKAMRAR
jgi:hypothetical protein